MSLFEPFKHKPRHVWCPYLIGHTTTSLIGRIALLIGHTNNIINRRLQILLRKSCRCLTALLAGLPYAWTCVHAVYASCMLYRPLYNVSFDISSFRIRAQFRWCCACVCRQLHLWGCPSNAVHRQGQGQSRCPWAVRYCTLLLWHDQPCSASKWVTDWWLVIGWLAIGDWVIGWLGDWWLVIGRCILLVSEMSFSSLAHWSVSLCVSVFMLARCRC